MTVRLASLFLISLLAACTGPLGGDLKKSSKERLAASAVPAADVTQAVHDNDAAALTLLGKLSSTTGNVVFSPYSVSSALGMAYAGMNGNTATQTAQALQFNLPSARLHPAFDALDVAIRADGNANSIQLSLDNQVWAQKGKSFSAPFLDTLATDYGAGVRELDFSGDPAGAADAINRWVSQETHGKIPVLVTKDQVGSGTRLTLTNALYLQANWENAFPAAASQPATFHNADGTQSQPTLMSATFTTGYARGQGVQVVTLPYQGSTFDLVAIMPDEGTFDAYLKTLDADALASLLASTQPTLLWLSLPKMDLATTVDFREVLNGLGMTDAFVDGAADFSGMDGLHDLVVQSVVQKSIFIVDEQGTTAASATEVSIGDGGAAFPAPQPTRLILDHPFLFALRHRGTGTLLFLGRFLHG